jgi:hypothetical protein
MYLLSVSGQILLTACTTMKPGVVVSQDRTVTIGTYSTIASASHSVSGKRNDEDARTSVLRTLKEIGYEVKRFREADFLLMGETGLSEGSRFENSERRMMMIGFYDRDSDSLFWSSRRWRSSISPTVEPRQLRQNLFSILEPPPHGAYGR